VHSFRAIASGEVTIDTLERLDLNIDAQAMDTPTMIQRRTSMEPVESGWSLFDTNWTSVMVICAATANQLRQVGLTARRLRHCATNG
jgi:hypothetical protein